MPYASNEDLPKGVKGNLPSHGQDIWRSAHNAAMKQYKGSEEKAAAVAWAAVKNKYKKGKDGDWVAKDGLVDGVTTAFLSDTVQLIEDKAEPTSDGYLKAFARVARTGVQLYKGKEVGRPDLTDVAIYRPPEEVFHRKAMRSLAYRPLTYIHPDHMVTSTTWKQDAVGFTGEEVVRDGESVRVPMMLCDQAAIDAYRHHGHRELSVGYSTELKWGKGRAPDGSTYDARQTAIRANHIALVPVARGGSALRIGDQAMRNCPNCGAAVSADAERCPSCNYDLKLGQTDALPNQTTAGTCVRCGATVPPGAWRCPMCQHNVGAPVTDADPDYPEQALYDREFSQEKRKELAKSGKAMSHGGYPIQTVGDLKNAIKAFGRAKNPGKTKAHIISRARALGATNLLPEGWTGSSAKDAASGGNQRRIAMRTVMIDGIPVEFIEDRDAAVVERHLKNLQFQIDQNAKKKADEEEDDEKKERGYNDALKARDAAVGEVKMLKKQLADATPTPEKLDVLVKERQGVIDAAAQVLGKGFAFDGKANIDIMRAVVAAKLGQKAVIDMSDASIEGAFAVATAPGAATGVERLATGLSDAMRHSSAGSYAQIAQDGGAMSLQDAKALRDRAWMERNMKLRDAWRTPGVITPMKQ